MAKLAADDYSVGSLKALLQSATSTPWTVNFQSESKVQFKLRTARRSTEKITVIYVKEGSQKENQR